MKKIRTRELGEIHDVVEALVAAIILGALLVFWLFVVFFVPYVISVKLVEAGVNNVLVFAASLLAMFLLLFLTLYPFFTLDVEDRVVE